MDNKIKKSFSGILDFPMSDEIFPFFFHVNGDFVTLIPSTERFKDEFYKNIEKYNSNENKDGIWYYGFSENGQSVAFFNPSRLSFSMTFPVNLGAARFHSPIIFQSTSTRNIKLDTFNIIEFRGGVIDSLYMPSIALDEKYVEKCIEFKEQESYTKKYAVNVNGESFEIIYTISALAFVMETGKIPDLRNNIHSILRFRFSTAQPASKFGKYFTYALKFFQFCSGSINIGFDVRLYKTDTMPFTTTVLTRVFDGFDDYANDNINFMKVINFPQLEDKLPRLFELLNEKDTEPYMMFLPKRNKDIGRIHYTDVTDLCVSLEREFDFIKKEAIKEDREQAKDLAKNLNKFIDSNTCSDYVKQKAKNIINGNLPALRPTLREKIKSLYDDYSEIVNRLSDLSLRGGKKPLTKEEFKRMINRFTDIRNSTSHAGIVWNEGINIFYHLELIVYLNVLKRAGYLPEESQNILMNLFERKFL